VIQKPPIFSKILIGNKKSNIFSLQLVLKPREYALA